MKPYFPGVPRLWERLEPWDSLSSSSLHAPRLFLLNHFVSSYTLFVTARLVRGQKGREKGRKVNDDKNSAESTHKKRLFPLGAIRGYSTETFRVMFGMVLRFPAL